MTDSTDLVGRLRAPWTQYDGKREILCNEAANEIEQLQSKLREIEAETREAVAAFLAKEYPDNANTNAFCAAIRSHAQGEK